MTKSTLAFHNSANMPNNGGSFLLILCIINLLYASCRTVDGLVPMKLTTQQVPFNVEPFVGR